MAPCRNHSPEVAVDMAIPSHIHLHPTQPDEYLPLTVAAVETEVLRIHSYLLSLDGALSPSPKINATLTRLITLLTSPLLEDPTLLTPLLQSAEIQNITPSLRMLCADAEYQMELWWAERVVSSSDPWRMLESFPYLDNYHALTRLERHSLLSVGAAPDLPWTVLGSGPLPLSAITLALQVPDILVTCVERCPLAAKLSQDLIAALGLAARIEVVRTDAENWMGVHGGEEMVTMVASLLRGKERVLERIAEGEGWALVRSARGARRLVYEKVEVWEVTGVGLKVVGRVEPYECEGGVVNSVVIARGRGGSA